MKPVRSLPQAVEMLHLLHNFYENYGKELLN